MSSIDIKLCESTLCTGCGACVGVCPPNAISYHEDIEGFFYPIINDDICIKCHRCEKTCPVFNPLQLYNKPRCYAAWSTEFNIRTHSSSGGIFSELAIAIINEGGIVVGASLDNRNGYVYHCIIETIDELSKLQGSKYVQSRITRDVLLEILKNLRNHRKVLFTGTPCQVAGVRSLANDNKNLYTMDVVCHGVPSPKLFAKIHKSIRDRIKYFEGYFFRDMSNWLVCTSVNININGRIKNRPLVGEETFYQDAFLKGYLHRESCYRCRYASTERVGDITVADFWGIGSKKAITNEHKKGCSAVLINSPKGEFLLQQIRNRIYAEERDVYETIDAGNHQLKEPSPRPSERENFYNDAYSLSYTQLIRKYKLKFNKKASFFIRVKTIAKNIILKIAK
jgi:coenzyme F420-reducing hydrogenase beta subunit